MRDSLAEGNGRGREDRRGGAKEGGKGRRRTTPVLHHPIVKRNQETAVLECRAKPALPTLRSPWRPTALPPQ